MERFRHLIESLDRSPPKDPSALLDRLRTAAPGKHAGQIIDQLEDLLKNNADERKLREAVLKEIVSSYRRLEQSIPGMVFEHVVQPDGQGSFRYVAETSQDLFGIHPKDVLTDERTLFNLEHPDDQTRSREFIRQTIKTLQPGRIDLRHVINEEVRWFEVIVHPNLGPNGDVIVDGIAIEITDRKRTEEALREREERLRISNEAARVGTYGTDLEADRVYWSPELCDVLGVPPGSERTQKTAFEVVHPDDLERVLAESRRGMNPNGDGRFSSEHRIIRPDSQERWVLWRGRTIFRESASGPIPSKRIGACFDITERKQMEIERKQAEETLRKYERIVSTSHDQMALVNREYIYEIVNESFLKAHHKQREQVVGRKVPEVIGERLFRTKIQFRLDQALSGKTDSYQESNHFAGLGRRIMDVTYLPLVSQSGKAEGVVLNYRDITETRKLEKQLMQSQKLEAIGTLAGGVAHEINNPINGIMNYAQLIIDRSTKGNPAAGLAAEIIHETERVSGIVRNLLAFGRHEKQPYCQACMPDIVSSVLSLIRTLIRLDRIDLEVDVQEGLPQLKCRSQEIQQVLMNLLTNARDAINQRYPGPHSEKKIRISINLIEKESRKLIRTTVEDNGIGIKPSIRDQIFDPFFTTKSKAGGTGLGLSISYGIVKDHGGELTVESNAAAFTRFHMDLPAALE